MGVIFFSGGGGEEGGWGYFWEVVVGVHHPLHLIFTLFQSNIYKVNVREFLPRDKTDKGMSWGMCSHFVDHHVKQKYYIYSLGQLERLYNTISDKNKT